MNDMFLSTKTKTMTKINILDWNKIKNDSKY